MSTFHTPTDVEVKAMLGMLFDDFDVVAGDAVTGATPGDVVATYLDDQDNLVALCLFDISLAAFSGCSLTMLPMGAAEDAVASKELDPRQIENIGEVMNIASRLLMNGSTPHLRYDKIHMSGSVPDDVQALIASGARIDWKMSIGKYGSGNASFIAS